MQNSKFLCRIWKRVNSAKHRIAIASKTITGQYGFSTVLQQVNVQSDHQCKFLGVLCVESWSTDSWGCGPKTRGASGSVKISLSAMQAPIRQKQPNFKIPYFHPSKCRLLHTAARGTCPLRPLPAATASAEGKRRKIRTTFKYSIHHRK